VKRGVAGLATTLLVSGGLSLAGLGLGAGAANAYTYGPFQWCPGQDMPNDPPRAATDLVWDMSVCHTYYIVGYKRGNVGDYIWADAGPPPPPAHNPRCLPGPGCAPWP